MYISDTKTSLAEESFRPLNLKDLISRYLYHWPLFVISVFFFLTISFLYLRYSESIYSINSVLLIKDEKKGGMPKAGDILNEIDLFGNSKVVENEIEILKSKTLMKEVVRRLNLSVTLQEKGRFKNSNLYLNPPLTIKFVEFDKKYLGKQLRIECSEKGYTIEDKDSEIKIRGDFNKLQRNALGVYKISKSKSYNVDDGPMMFILENPSEVVDNCLKVLSVNLANKQSTVLKLSYEDAVAERGQDILNTLVQVYNEAALSDKNKTTQSTMEFIDERLKLISGELTVVEKDVETFKSSRGITDITSDANLFLENVRVNDAKLNEINLKISVIEDIQRYVNSNSADEKLPSTLGIDDPVLLSQINQLSELQLQRDQLLSTTTEINPLVVTLLKQIETTREGIKSTIQNILKTLLVSKSDLMGNDEQFQGSIKKLPGQERQLIGIKRQQTIKESLYLYLLQKKEEAALSYASSIADSRIVDSAFYSNKPIKPRKVLTYLGGLFLGFLIPIGLIHIKEILNDKIEDQSELIKLTKAPVLGRISRTQDLSPIVILENSRNAISEQFRSLRTNLQYLQGKVDASRGNVTMFTSGMSGEGKTFVASNLSVALALSGKKTVLLELDLRKPKVSKYLELDNTIGLSNYLIGRAEEDNIIKQSTIHNNLFIIGSGPIPPNPSELLLQGQVDKLFEYLRQEFDEIIVDSPPIGLVTDSQILARIADVTLYIVRQSVTRKEQINNLNDIYKSSVFPKLNVILNGVSSSGNYGYGYGYGYYSDDKSNDSFKLKDFVKEFFKRF